MSDKPVLFLDSDFLQNTWGQDNGDTERFNRIMDGYFEKYDVRITNVVYDESTFGYAEYSKDLAIKNWLESKNITPIATSVPGFIIMSYFSASNFATQ